MSKRKHLRACEARRDAILRAHECDASPTDAKVLDAVFWFLSEWDNLSAVVPLDHLVAVAFVVYPWQVQRWQRRRVNESLRRWDDWGIVRTRARRGRPPKDGVGPAVEIALIEVAERHPVSRVLYRDIKHPDGGVTFESRKAPRSDEESTPASERKHPTPTPRKRARSEEPSEEPSASTTTRRIVGDDEDEKLSNASEQRKRDASEHLVTRLLDEVEAEVRREPGFYLVGEFHRVYDQATRIATENGSIDLDAVKLGLLNGYWRRLEHDEEPSDARMKPLVQYGKHAFTGLEQAIVHGHKGRAAYKYAMTVAKQERELEQEEQQQRRNEQQ